MGGIHVTRGAGFRKEAWPFYRTISGVRLCWGIEEPKGPEGPQGVNAPRTCVNAPRTSQDKQYFGKDEQSAAIRMPG